MSEFVRSDDLRDGDSVRVIFEGVWRDRDGFHSHAYLEVPFCGSLTETRLLDGLQNAARLELIERPDPPWSKLPGTVVLDKDGNAWQSNGHGDWIQRHGSYGPMSITAWSWAELVAKRSPLTHLVPESTA